MMNIIPPKGDFETFADEVEFAEKLKEWGLTKKKTYWYKDGKQQHEITIFGYEAYGKTTEHHTIIIKFEDDSLSCIHPAYLKEMQSPSFSKITTSTGVKKEAAAPKKASTNKTKSTQPKKKTEKQPKIELPGDKVHFSAEVQQFAKSWNHFNEENDEVVVLKNVVIEGEIPLNIGLSWCSHSKTLKKFELTPGDHLEFDGKIVKKKLPAGKDVEEQFIVTEPVLYKINNPSKIKKS